MKLCKTCPTRQSKHTIGYGLGLGLVWVSLGLIGKEPMHSQWEIQQHKGLKVFEMLNWRIS